MNYENYFDYAAATPMLPEAISAMQPYLSQKFYNPSALYLAAQDNKKALENFRKAVSQEIGAKPNEIIFTAGGTEANNLAIKGVMDANKPSNLIISTIEHESVYKPAVKYNCKELPVNSKGFIGLEKLKQLIDDQTVLISIIYANNEIGTIEPIKKISQVIKEILDIRKSNSNPRPLYLHSDACQAVNYLDLQVARLGIDLMTINAGKIYGPKQCGALYIKSGVNLDPIILGGGQERGFRSGSENIANIAGFASAWKVVRSDYKQESKNISILRDDFIKKLQTKLPKLQINGPVGHDRLANSISVTIKGVDNEKLVMMLDEKGFMVATGSACSASKDEPSHVLKAIGLTDIEAQSTIRISLGRFTTKKSLDILLKTLVKIVDKS